MKDLNLHTTSLIPTFHFFGGEKLIHWLCSTVHPKFAQVGGIMEVMPPIALLKQPNANLLLVTWQCSLPMSNERLELSHGKVGTTQ